MTHTVERRPRSALARMQELRVAGDRSPGYESDAAPEWHGVEDLLPNLDAVPLVKLLDH